MKKLAENKAWAIYSSVGSSVKEGTVKGKANAAGPEIALKIDDKFNEYNTVWVKIEAAPNSAQTADGLFWNFFTGKKGGEVSVDDTEYGFAQFDFGGGTMSFTLNSDNVGENDVTLRITVWGELTDTWMGGSPLLSATLKVIDDDRITGTSGNDKLVGSSAIHDLIYGDAGNDYISANGGNDTVYAGTGNDTVGGGAGNDSLFGEDGNDRLFGRGGHDYLNGGRGKDILYGNAGNDHLVGGGGNDKLYGGAGNDKLSGDAGNDVIYGDGGADKLYGGAGKDVLSGGTGNDSLFGGAGNDVLRGGSGSDAFIFYGNDGRDVIRDFEDNRDKIYIISNDVDLDFDEVLIYQSGKNTVVNFDATTVILQDTNASLITQADFKVWNGLEDPFNPLM